MRGKILLLLTLIGAVFCSSISFAANDVAAAANGSRGENNGSDGDAARRLSIYERVLLNDPSEQARIDAGILMLESEDGGARDILIKALVADDNPAARSAVCKALVNSRAGGKRIANKGDFIQPLVEILVKQSGDTAKLAAEATLIFDYSEISEALKKVAYSPAQAVGARLNAIAALKLQPDKRAIEDLMNLLDERDGEVVQAAERTLQSLGIPVVGKTPAQIRQIKEDMKRQSTEEFFRGLLRLQEREVNKLREENQRWQKLYLEVLDQAYLGIAEEAGRSAFLDTYLGGTEAAAKLWALEKVDQWRKGKSTVPPQIGQRLILLISDQNPEVRLKTATLLSMMGELNSAQRLLDQIRVETDERIKLELFVALGKACYDGLLPTSVYKTPVEVRNAALEMSSVYLSGSDTAGISAASKVMGKLLERDGLEDADLAKYLGLLSTVYKGQTGGEANLRGEILGSMAQLCNQSVYKSQAAALFGPIFRESLGDESEVVRQQAVEGLKYIGKNDAMVIFRARGFAGDPSSKIRTSVIQLAGEVGGREDLEWLSEKLGTGAEGDLAWAAMLSILKGSEAEVVNNWVDKLEFNYGNGSLSDEQMIWLLEVAERKANGAGNEGQRVKAIQDKLASLYTKTGKYEQAAKYWGTLRNQASTPAERKAFSARLLEVYLKQPNPNNAVHVLNNYLENEDLRANDVLVKTIENFIAELPESYDSGVLTLIFDNIALPKGVPRSEWERRVQAWRAKLSSRNTQLKREEPGS